METTDRWGNPRSIRITAHLDDRETGCRFSAYHDAYHLPFPSNPDHLLLAPSDSWSDASHEHISTLCGKDSRTNTHDGVRYRQNSSLLKLPIEVLDLVLSHLTPPALDAARFTCRSLHGNIMQNRWVLSSVLTSNVPGSSGDRSVSSLGSAGSDGDMSIRSLLKSLDQKSDLLSTYRQSDAWRTRFRVQTFDFSTSEAHCASNFHLRSASRVGSALGLMILRIVSIDELPEIAPSVGSILLFFAFDNHDFPLYAGSAEHPGSEGRMDIVCIAESELKCSRVIKARIDGQLKYFSIIPRRAFSDSEVQFQLNDLEDAQAAQNLAGYINKKSFTSTSGAFAKTPGGDVVRSEIDIADTTGEAIKSSEGQSLFNNARRANFVAEQEDIGLKGPTQSLERTKTENDDMGYLFGTAKLRCPYSHCVLRNVAMAPFPTKTGIQRVAIIWQSAADEDCRSELYLYDIPRASADAGELDYFKGEALGNVVAGQIEIQGKRVASLGLRMGGIHSYSGVWNLAATAADTRRLEEENELGGLQLPQAEGMRNVQYQKCFVWGPIERGSSISVECKVFDLSFADPEKLQMMELGHDRGQVRHLPNAWSIMSLLNRGLCACAFHDAGYCITLPSAEQLLRSLKRVQKGSKENRHFSLWPWNCKGNHDVYEFMPSVDQNDSVMRREAIDRQTEWYRERIRGMRKAGLSDFDIAEIWGSARWTQYGQVRKPDGWQNL